MIGDRTDTLEIVSFAAGGFQFAVEARQIDGMLSDIPEKVVAAEALLGLAAVEAAQRRFLRVGTHCIEVGEPLELRSLPADRIHPLPDLVAARINIHDAKALVLESSGSMLLLDLQALLARSGTITPGTAS